ncbi:MAG: cupin domain-containing protein [gamma proteobacterium symbiont of Taylorina sp.]|nr:cupin domain-containing protein [gamma proteobacterium symbiont of Taylorina sp.]
MSYITQFNANAQFSTTERCDINELLNSPLDSDCSIAQASVAPGIVTQLHAVKNTIERYVILAGEGRVFINDQPPEIVKKFDVICIPENVPQKIENTSQTELIFLCICTPRFEQKNYQNLEVYQSISCAMHSELELAIMHGNILNIQLKTLTNEQSSSKDKVIPYDIISRKGEGEFLLAFNQADKAIEVRLDQIKYFEIIRKQGS